MNVALEAHVYQGAQPQLVRFVVAFPDVYDFELTPEALDSILAQSLEEDAVPDTRPKLAKGTLEHIAPKQVYQRSLVRGDHDCKECTICLDSFRPRKHVRRLPCGHLFCSKCIEKWVSQHNAACPTCRAALH